nr:OmpA family protein [Methylomarinum sp. Ch1-1]MDP4520146.1 OmpA family protein [Methylomarinum sp. Ch1-1]
MPQSQVLSAQVDRRLSQVADYLQALKTQRLVIISETAIAGRADHKWFTRRAEQVSERLIKLGLAKSRIRIETGSYHRGNDNELVLKLFGPDALGLIYYRKGNTALTGKEKQRLRLLARYLQDYYREGRVLISSHTDSKGRRAANLKISEQRGNVVKAYLVDQGIASERLLVKAYGESRPVKSNRFPRGRAQNRRVVISFLD